MMKLFMEIKPDFGRRLSATLGFVTIAVSSMFICGYVLGAPALYIFPKGTPAVALPTSILFFILGVAVYVLAVTREAAISKQREPDEVRLARLEAELAELKPRIHTVKLALPK